MVTDGVVTMVNQYDKRIMVVVDSGYTAITPTAINGRGHGH